MQVLDVQDHGHLGPSGRRTSPAGGHHVEGARGISPHVALPSVFRPVSASVMLAPAVHVPTDAASLERARSRADESAAEPAAALRTTGSAALAAALAAAAGRPVQSANLCPGGEILCPNAAG